LRILSARISFPDVRLVPVRTSFVVLVNFRGSENSLGLIASLDRTAALRPIWPSLVLSRINTGL